MVGLIEGVAGEDLAGRQTTAVAHFLRSQMGVRLENPRGEELTKSQPEWRDYEVMDEK